MSTLVPSQVGEPTTLISADISFKHEWSTSCDGVNQSARFKDCLVSSGTIGKDNVSVALEGHLRSSVVDVYVFVTLLGANVSDWDLKTILSKSSETPFTEFQLDSLETLVK